MSTAERLEARGEARGRRLGEAQGEMRGRAKTLLHQIALKFGPPDAATTARIERADTDALVRWTARILTAEALDDVFG